MTAWWNTNYKPYDAIEIPAQVLREIQAYTKNCNIEISGFGRTHIKEEGGDTILCVENIKVFEQVCSMGSTLLDDEALSRIFVNAVQNDEDPADWNFWWHSHVKSNVFFSGTDTATLERISKNGGMLIGLCTNHYNDMVATVYENGKEVGEDIQIRVMMDKMENTDIDTIAVIKKNVTEKVYTVQKYKEGKHHYGYSWFD